MSGSSFSSDIQAAEGALNLAILAADISTGHEEFLDVFDAFYSEEVSVTFERPRRYSVDGKDAVRSAIASLLMPVHVLSEVAGLSVVMKVDATASDENATKSAWTVGMSGLGGETCTLAWVAERVWNEEGRVVSEVHRDFRQTGKVLEERGVLSGNNFLLPYVAE